MLITFWICFTLVAYIFLLYPIIIALVAKIKFGKDDNNFVLQELPSVTLLVPAHNEELVANSKVQNCLELEYEGPLTICLISDSSTDATDTIFEKAALEHYCVRFIKVSGGRGKAVAVNHAMESISSEISIFSDANVMLQRDCVARLVDMFADPNVGGVAGQLDYISVGSAIADSSSIYWRYEEFIKNAESAVGSTIGGDGSIFGIRSKLFRPVHPRVLDDFSTSMGVIFQNYLFKFQPLAKAVEHAAEVSKEEFNRKVRIANRSWNTFLALKADIFEMSKLNLFKFISHKLMRWLAFFPIAVGFFSACSLAVSGSDFFIILIVLAVGLFLVGWVVDRSRVHFKFRGLVTSLYFFVLLNIHNAVGICSAMMGVKTVNWTKPVSSRKGAGL